MNQLVPIAAHAPALVRTAGERAQTRFWEFFVSNIRNPHTRLAYGRSIAEFLTWCEQHGLASIPPTPVSTASVKPQPAVDPCRGSVEDRPFSPHSPDGAPICGATIAIQLK